MSVHRVANSLADANPTNGLALKFARTWYASDQQIAQQFNDLSLLLYMFQGREDALKPDQWVRLRSYERVLTEDLVDNLRSGILAARGFTPGHLNLSDIPAQWWEDVALDFRANSAAARGVNVGGVLIFDAGWEIQHGTPGSLQQVSTKTSDPPQAAWDKWIAAQSKNPTRRDAEAWALQHGYSIPRTRDLHKRLGNSLGRPRSK